MAEKKIIKQAVLVLSMEEGTTDVRLDFNEGPFPMELVLQCMENVIKQYRNKNINGNNVN